MERIVEVIITFWLNFFVWQRALFYNFWKDLGFIITTVFFKVIESMKKVLYIVARGRKQKEATRAPVELQMENQESSAPELPLPSPPVMENPIPDPMVVSTREMETVSSMDNGDAADVIIRVEIPQGPNADTTLNAAYHLAVMEKLNIITTGMYTIHERIENMALNLEALTAEVNRVKGVHESTVVLIHRVTGELIDIKAALAAAVAHVVPPVDTSALDALVADLKSSTDGLATAVAANAPAVETVTVVLHADDLSTPTVEVVMPEVLPEVVETTVEQIVETVDLASPEPQFTITVEEASPEVEAAVEATSEADLASPEVTVEVEGVVHETAIMESDPGQVDVVVVSDAVEAAPAETAGVDVLADVVEAFEAAPEVSAELVPTVTTTLNADNPEIPTVEIVMPEVLPEVVVTSTEQIVQVVDPASVEPQFTITVEEAPALVVDAVEAAAPEVVADPAVVLETTDGELASLVIETQAETVDVTVTAPVEEVAMATEAGVDVLATVEAAFEATPEVTAEEAPVTE